MNYSNVIDTPRPAGSKDLLGVDSSVQALVNFISTAQMPTTLAIQGEWGSGKTSLMNQIRFALCETDGPDPNKHFYGIWINTWQYALMRSPENTLLNIIGGITHEIMNIIHTRHQTALENARDSMKGVFRKLARAGAKTALSMAGGATAAVDELLPLEEESSDVDAFRKTLEDTIQRCLVEDKKSGNDNKGFIFFIDDLDRIDPPVAVQILELLKNLFEVDNCVFILAIDYDVVVKGLEPKFGPLTTKNEREFRSFFDKIIQLPFSMPVATYNISEYLSDALVGIGYYSVEELDETITFLLEDDNENESESEENNTDSEEKTAEFSRLEILVDMASDSTGSNPRAVKRLINTLSLINIIYKIKGKGIDLSANEKLTTFAVVCIQIAYHTIYQMLMAEPNFKEWNEEIARKFSLDSLDEETKKNLDSLEGFEEEWQQIIYRAGMNSVYLSPRVSEIVSLLQTIEAFLPDDADLGEEMGKVLGFASVTTVTSKDESAKVKQDGRKERVRTGEDEYYQLQLENNIPESSLSMLKTIHANIRTLFGELVTYEYSTSEIFGIVVHRKDNRRKTLIKLQPVERRVIYRLPAITGQKVFRAPADEKNKQELTKFYQRLLDVYNDITDKTHRLSKETIKNVLAG